MVALLGTGIANVMVAVAIISVPTLGRLTRVAVLSQRREQYVEAARSLGAADARVVARHVLPNVVPPLLVQTALVMADAVLLEAGFSFLGLGSRPPPPSWGTMLNSGRNFLSQAPWLGVFPGLAVTLTVLGLNALGDSRRSALSHHRLNPAPSAPHKEVRVVKIVKVEPLFLRYRYPAHLSYRFAAGVVQNLDAALIRVTADNGEYGLGEVTFGTHTYEPVLGIAAHFNRVLEGFPAREVNRAWETMYQESRFWNRYGIGIAVMGGINIAMYDLLGKLLGLPVYQLLGGVVRSRIRVYASNGLFTTAEPLIADAKRAQAGGFDAYKLRVTDPRTVGPLVAAFREALGRDMDVMVDAGEAGGAVPWSVSISQKIAKALEPLEPLWLEEPVRVENIEGYVEMRQSTTVNIAGAESLPTAHAFLPYLTRGAFDIVQFDIATSGFTEGTRIASLAAVHEKPLAIHSWGTLVTIMAGVHFGLVTPNCAITEYNFTEHPLNELLATQSVRPREGHIGAPDAPGLGVKLDPTLLERFPYTAGRNTMMSTAEKDLAL